MSVTPEQQLLPEQDPSYNSAPYGDDEKLAQERAEWAQFVLSELQPVGEPDENGRYAAYQDPSSGDVLTGEQVEKAQSRLAAYLEQQASKEGDVSSEQSAPEINPMGGDGAQAAETMPDNGATGNDDYRGKPQGHGGRATRSQQSRTAQAAERAARRAAAGEAPEGGRRRPDRRKLTGPGRKDPEASAEQTAATTPVPESTQEQTAVQPDTSQPEEALPAAAQEAGAVSAEEQTTAKPDVSTEDPGQSAVPAEGNSEPDPEPESKPEEEPAEPSLHEYPGSFDEVRNIIEQVNGGAEMTPGEAELVVAASANIGLNTIGSDYDSVADANRTLTPYHIHPSTGERIAVSPQLAAEIHRQAEAARAILAAEAERVTAEEQAAAAQEQEAASHTSDEGALDPETQPEAGADIDISDIPEVIIPGSDLGETDGAESGTDEPDAENEEAEEDNDDGEAESDPDTEPEPAEDSAEERGRVERLLRLSKAVGGTILRNLKDNRLVEGVNDAGRKAFTKSVMGIGALKDRMGMPKYFKAYDDEGNYIGVDKGKIGGAAALGVLAVGVVYALAEKHGFPGISFGGPGASHDAAGTLAQAAPKSNAPSVAEIAPPTGGNAAGHADTLRTSSVWKQIGDTYHLKSNEQIAEYLRRTRKLNPGIDLDHMKPGQSFIMADALPTGNGTGAHAADVVGQGAPAAAKPSAEQLASFQELQSGGINTASEAVYGVLRDHGVQLTPSQLNTVVEAALKYDASIHQSLGESAVSPERMLDGYHFYMMRWEEFLQHLQAAQESKKAVN